MKDPITSFQLYFSLVPRIFMYFLCCKAGDITRCVQVGTWGRQNGGPQSYWSFKLEKDHYLSKITINHDDAVYSLIFTSESEGFLRTSNKVGGLAVGDTFSEVKSS